MPTPNPWEGGNARIRGILQGYHTKEDFFKRHKVRIVDDDHILSFRGAPLDAVEPNSAKFVREWEFLFVLAVQLRVSISKSGHAGFGEVFSAKRPYWQLTAIRNTAIGKGNLHRWLATNLPQFVRLEETVVSGLDVIEELVRRFDFEAKVYQTLEARSVVMATQDALPLPQIAAPLPSGLRNLAIELQKRTPTGAVSPTKELGNVVHAYLQLHYRVSHPTNCVLTESRLFGPCATPSGTLRPGAYSGANIDLSVWAFALGTGRRSQHRPDIVDLSTREIWEIKPRTLIGEGLVELWGLYLTPANATIAEFNRSRGRSAELLNLYRPGTSWKPPPFCFIPPRLVAWIHAEIPGLIYYDLLSAPPVPVSEPVRAPDPLASVLGCLLLLAILSPLPGDEIALGALIAGAAAS